MDCHVDNESYTGMDLTLIIIRGSAFMWDCRKYLDVATTSSNLMQHDQ